MENRGEMIELVDLFIENERLLGEFYGMCVEKIPEFKDSWEGLQKMEEQHRSIFEEIKASIEQAPQRWNQGKFFAQTLKISIGNLKTRMQEFRDGKANQRYILNFLMDCEQSLIETELSKAFQGDHLELLAKLNTMQNETLGHKNLLRSILAKVK